MPLFEWYSSANANSYDLQILDEESTILKSVLNITAVNFQLESMLLPAGHTYFWQVRAKNFNGASEWSTCDFYIIPQPDAPVLLSPCDNYINTQHPLLAWLANDNTNYYELKIYNSLDDEILSINSISTSYYQLNENILSLGNSYTWKVRGHNICCTSQWADCNFYYYGLPAQPSLSSPCNATVSTLTPVMQWTGSGLFVRYDLQVIDDGNNIIINAPNIGNTSYQIPANILERCSSYTWRVRAHNYNGYSNWSNTCYFSTEASYRWTAQASGTTAHFWRIEFLDSKTGWASASNALCKKTTDGGTSWITQYTTTGWRLDALSVVDSNNVFVASPGGVIKHTTNSGSSWLTSPIDTSYYFWGMDFYNSSIGLVVGSHPTTYAGRILRTLDSGASWQIMNFTGAGLLDVFLVNSTTGWACGSGGIITKTASSGSTWTSQNSGTFQDLWGIYFLNENYGWAVGVNGTTNDLWGLWFENESLGWVSGFNGTILKYSCQSDTSLQAPTLIAPENDSSNVQIKPAFSWNMISRASTYRLQLASDQNFINLIKDTIVAGTSYNYHADLNYNTAYYWRVKANNSSQTSSWSIVWSFSTLVEPFFSCPWTTDTTLNHHTIIIPGNINPTVDGRTLQNGDAIGFFYDNNGVYKCGGFAVWSGENLLVNIWQDNPATPPKDGFLVDEGFAAKVWDSRSGIARDAKFICRTEDPATFQVNGITYIFWLSASNENTISIDLKSGWNMVSSWISPNALQISDILAGVQDDFLIAKDYHGFAYFPLFEINSIGNWSNLNSYYLYMIRPSVLQINGVRINPEATPIALRKGWNYVAYLRSLPMQASTALASIIPYMLVCKNVEGETYNPVYSTNTLEQGTTNAGKMLPGKGYLIYVTQPCTLTYPAN